MNGINIDLHIPEVLPLTRRGHLGISWDAESSDCCLLVGDGAREGAGRGEAARGPAVALALFSKNVN